MLRHAILAVAIGGVVAASSAPAAEVKGPDIAALAEKLSDKDVRVRQRAAWDLGNLGSPAKPAIPQLVKALKDSEAQVRYRAARALAQIGPAAVPDLMEALRGEDIGLRSWAARALAFLGPDAKGAVPALVENLGHKNAGVRMSAVIALGEIGPGAKEAVPRLKEAAQESDNLQMNLLVEVAIGKINTDPKEPVDLKAGFGMMPVRLTPAQEAQLDQAIKLYILAEKGQIPPQMRAMGVSVTTQSMVIASFGPEAIPALVRGFTLAANIAGVCPSTYFLNLLLAFVPQCNDIGKIDYVLQHLGEGVSPRAPGLGLNARELAPLFEMIRTACIQRRAELVLLTLAAKRAEALRQRVSEMSRLGDADVKERLKDKRAEERWAAIWLLAYRWVHCEDALIDRLADPSPDVREAARQALVRLSRGTDFGPAPNAKPADRDKAIQKWRDWWAMQDDNPKNKKDSGTAIKTADAEDGKQKEADRLTEAAVKGTSRERADALAKLQAGKGGPYTLALSVAIGKLQGDAQAEARRVLVERLTRLTAGTLAQYLESDDAELRRAAALALAAKEDTSQVPKLIALLEDREPLAARAAHAALKALAGEDFGPARDATAEERAEAVKKWRQWWEKHKEGKK